jgi:hypothetical protein
MPGIDWSRRRDAADPESARVVLAFVASSPSDVFPLWLSRAVLSSGSARMPVPVSDPYRKTMSERRGYGDRRSVPRMGDRRRGRPRIAVSVSRLPACTVPTALHDALSRKALRLGVSVAQVMRDALFFDLKNSAMATTSA